MMAWLRGVLRRWRHLDCTHWSWQSEECEKARREGWGWYDR